MLAAPSAHNRPEIRYAWRGPSLLILDQEARAGEHALSGFFFRAARYLRTLALEIDGEKPFFCSAAAAAPNRLAYTFIYPPVEAGSAGGSGSGGSGKRHGLLYRTLDLHLGCTVHPASAVFSLMLSNRWHEQAAFDLSWLLSADYADLLDTLSTSGARAQAAPVESIPEEDGVRFRYTHPALPLETHIRARGGGPWTFADGRLSTHLSLRRQETVTVRLHLRAVDPEDPLDEAAERRREARLQEWFAAATQLYAPGETPLVEITNRAVQDLGSFALLEGEEAEWLSPAAGLPLYPTLFGRDALTAAWQAAVFDRGEMLKDLLVKLGRLQGRQEEAWRDEEPGRIIQQAKRNPRSRLNEMPFDRYYGDFASPFMYVISLGQLYGWTGERSELEKHWDTARRVLDWARDYGDHDGDGYLEYRTQSKEGPKNQGWKDSDNAVVYADGSQVPAPIAPCEIQSYWYAAQQFMAVLSAVMGAYGDARALWKACRDLKARFNRDFWMAEEGFVAFGLDPDKRQIRSITSNAGHCLTAGIIADENVPRLVRRLFQPDLFSGWGIRTLSTKNPAYHPLSYHLGSVWPVENGTILFGLRRYGFDDRALELARSLYDLARIWEGYRIPECVGGYSREAFDHPGAYPRANVPQAWNQSAFPILVQAILGLRPVAALDLLAVDPILPPWLPELVVKHLRVGGATVTLRFYRDADGASHFETVEKKGTLHIVRQPPLDDLSVGIWDRLGALVKEVLPF